MTIINNSFKTIILVTTNGMVVVSALMTLIYTVIIPNAADAKTYYTLCLCSAAISYIFSLYLALGPPKLDQMYAAAIMQNTNMHYLFITLVFLPSFFIWILPVLVTFSLFTLSSNAINTSWLALFHNSFNKLIGQAPLVMRYICYWEAWIFLILLYGLFTQGALLRFLAYGQFIMFRYLLDGVTRQVWDQIGAKLDELSSTYLPLSIQNMYDSVRRYIYNITVRAATPYNPPPPP